MGYAIEMFFDGVGESRLLSLWDDFVRFGATTMRNGNARPHISLAVADSVDLPAPRQLLSDFAQSLQPFELTLAALGWFTASEHVLFLAPKVTSKLLGLHERFFERFSNVADGVLQHYVPATWMPHCTLAMGLSAKQLGLALDACQSFRLPLACTVSEIGLVEFSPVNDVPTVSFGE